ncbi:unnamed protein product [Phyllotreta striolata]|uniref:Uncharacterized protein n=1 Tax=Phyllotreta striolata TaxID=444603 RepID=A0A9N9TF44_PHYSR|nr:unnamed protein product [Phyllotreta striolata]
MFFKELVLLTLSVTLVLAQIDEGLQRAAAPIEGLARAVDSLIPSFKAQPAKRQADLEEMKKRASSVEEAAEMRESEIEEAKKRDVEPQGIDRKKREAGFGRGLRKRDADDAETRDDSLDSKEARKRQQSIEPEKRQGSLEDSLEQADPEPIETELIPQKEINMFFKELVLLTLSVTLVLAQIDESLQRAAAPIEGLARAVDSLIPSFIGQPAKRQADDEVQKRQEDLEEMKKRASSVEEAAEMRQSEIEEAKKREVEPQDMDRKKRQAGLGRRLRKRDADDVETRADSLESEEARKRQQSIEPERRQDGLEE